MKCRANRFFQYWIPIIIYESLIFFLSSRPSPQIGPKIPYIDKFYHTIIYSVFALLLWRAFYYASAPFFKKRAGLFALIITIIFGLSDEWHQYFVKSRQADIFDFIFDALGAGITMVGVNWWYNGQKARKRDFD